MKSVIAIIVLVIVINVASILYPAWWWIMLIPILFGIFFPAKVHISSFLAFVAGLLAWGGLAIFKYNRDSQIITDRVAEVFSLPNGIALLIIVGLVAGILAGIAAATGSSLRSFFVKPKRKLDYY